MAIKEIFRSKLFYVFVAPLIMAAIMISPPIESISQGGWYILAIGILMVIWWVSEAIPLPVTALLPVLLFPLFGISSLKETSSTYAHPVVFLLIGGFIIAKAIEKYALHKRLALSILSRTGEHANMVVFGLMLCTYLISMWIPNTIAAALMLPIGLAIRDIVRQETKGQPKHHQDYFTIAALISIAFGANIGGMATLIGTPTNAIFAAYVGEQLDIVVDFWDWLKIGLPFSLGLFFAGWAVINLFVYPNRLGSIPNIQNLIRDELHQLSKIKPEEKRVFAIFALVVLLWLTKHNLPFTISDTAIAIFGSILCFAVPIRKTGQNLEFLLTKDDLSTLPWGILFLFGGGLALAKALQNEGLAELLAQSLGQYHLLEVWIFVGICLILIVSMTEFVGNIPIITIMLPVLANLALLNNIDPLLILIPATLAASCAFMLPTATPPNSVVFASGHLKVAHMVKAGIYMNIVSVILLMIGWFGLPGNIILN